MLRLTHWIEFDEDHQRISFDMDLLRSMEEEISLISDVEEKKEVEWLIQNVTDIAKERLQ